MLTHQPEFSATLGELYGRTCWLLSLRGLSPEGTMSLYSLPQFSVCPDCDGSGGIVHQVDLESDPHAAAVLGMFNFDGEWSIGEIRPCRRCSGQGFRSWLCAN